MFQCNICTYTVEEKKSIFLGPVSSGAEGTLPFQGHLGTQGEGGKFGQSLPENS